MNTLDTSVVATLYSGLASLIAGISFFDDDSVGYSLFREVFYSTEVPMVVVGLDMKPIYANSACEKFFGYSERELERMTFVQFTHPQDIEIDLELFNEIIDEKRERYLMRKRWIAKTGETVWGILSVNAVRDNEGKLISVVSIVTPIKTSDQNLTKAIQRIEDKVDDKQNFALKAFDKVANTKKPLRKIFAFFFFLLSVWLFIFNGIKDLIDLFK